MRKRSYRYPVIKRVTRRQVRNISLVILTLALTGLSLKAQYHFWKSLFGIETGVVASSVFEVLRLASLFSFLKWMGKKAIAGGILYVAIALFCGAVAITSWHSEILETQTTIENQYERKIQTRIDSVKAVYAKQAQVKIDKFDRDIYYIESLIAKTNSQSLVRRRIQLKDMRDDVVNKRDNFLSGGMNDRELWIEKNAPIVGLQFSPIEKTSTELGAIERALMETWHLDAEAAKKIVAIIFVSAIEIGIILLAFMTERRRGGDRGVTEHDSIVNYLKRRFEECDIERFIEKSRDIYHDRGKLPKSSELTVGLRPIREAVIGNGFKRKDIKMLFDHFDECDNL